MYHKKLSLIPVNERKLTAAKMIILFLFSILAYVLLFLLTFSTEMVLHASELSIKIFFDFLKMYPAGRNRLSFSLFHR